LEQFIINTHAFHNAHLVRQALPRHLTVPIALFLDRKTKHYEFAAVLRVTKDGKRKRAREKREEKKREANGMSTTARKDKKGKKSNSTNATQKRVQKTQDNSDDDSEDTSSDSESDDSDTENHARKRRRIRMDSDSDYEGRSGAVDEQADDEGQVRRSHRDRRAPARFADGDVDFNSD
jgi:hypothetical protein